LGSTTVIHFKGESTLKDENYAERFYGAMQVFYKKHFKSNFLFNTMVWIGIRVAYLFRTDPKAVKHKIERYMLVSDKIPKGLDVILKKPIQLEIEPKPFVEHTEVILDANVLSYKKIINYISDNKINAKAKFKILPKNSNFIIGSNSSKSRGEVIIFKNN
jgi:hypothetical protein